MDPPPPIRLELRRGALTALPLAVAVGLFGISFGVLATSQAAMDGVAVMAMSATTFAGSAQFAAAAVLAAGGQPLTAVAAALLLNARYLPIGVSVARFLAGGVLRRLALAQLIVDESWAIAARGSGTFDPHRLLGAGLVIWAAWIVGTAIGVVGGAALGDLTRLGLDAAFPALFLALLAPQLRNRAAVLAAIGGCAIALALTPFSPPGLPIIAAAAAALIGLRR
jgi:4-azaleucine resistance transporter AzlC